MESSAYRLQNNEADCMSAVGFILIYALCDNQNPAQNLTQYSASISFQTATAWS